MSLFTSISPDPPLVSTQGAGQAAVPKLRDSCQNCAASKLRCSKEKPSCTRCVKRGKSCKYFATKRAGRKQGSRSGIKTQRSTPINIGTPPTDGVMEAEMTQITMPREKSCYTDMLPESSWLSAPDSASASDPGHFMLDDIFGTSAALSIFGSPSADPIAVPPVDFDSVSDLLGSVNITSHLGADGSVWSTNDTTSGTPTVCSPHTPPTGQVLNQLDFLSFHEPRFKSACGCLPRVLELVKGAFPNPHHGSTLLGGDAFITERVRPYAASHWLEREGKTVEAIHRILECPCSLDSYVISIISLTVFKVTGSYKAAAHELFRASKGGRTSSAGFGNSTTCFDGRLESPITAEQCNTDCEEHHPVAAAQRLLYNFSRLQRLVNAVSQKLSNYREGKQGMGLSEGRVSDASEYFSHILFPLFSTTFTQLEIDLGRQLHALSAKLVGLSQ